MLTSQPDWDRKWTDIFSHYQRDLRHAYYINAIRRRSERRLLEIAAGSFRDVGALNKWGIDCHGLDFSRTAVVSARTMYPSLANKILQGNGYSMQFPDAAFDLSYHNGFWVLFREDNAIDQLLCEQIRVTRRRVVATVHNKHNANFVDYFRRKVSEGDSLFDIRFFEIDEIASLMMKRCRDVTVVPVGKAYRTSEDLLIRLGLGGRPILKAYFRLCATRYLTTSERLLCIGDLG